MFIWLNLGSVLACFLIQISTRTESENFLSENLQNILLIIFQYPSKGTPGAEKFVKDWLMPYINNDTSRFRGAIILDEITNYILEDDSQRPYPGSDKVRISSDLRCQ